MKTLLAYLLMVGLPVAGILAILRAGEGLSAPAAVHGTWRLASVEGGSCAALALKEGTTVEVEQSGPHLTARVAGGGGRLSGAIDGARISASAPRAPSSVEPDGCAAGGRLALDATVDAGARPGRMTGTLRAAGCASCAPAGFTAERVIAGRARREGVR